MPSNSLLTWPNHCIDEQEKKIRAEKELEANGGKDAAGAGSNDDDPMDNMNDDDPMDNMMNKPMGMVMVQGIQYFFSGFIMLKIPFALTAGFKSMFQRSLADSMILPICHRYHGTF